MLSGGIERDRALQVSITFLLYTCAVSKPPALKPAEHIRAFASTKDLAWLHS